jgi:hypothetical protein
MMDFDFCPSLQRRREMLFIGIPDIGREQRSDRIVPVMT